MFDHLKQLLSHFGRRAPVEQPVPPPRQPYAIGGMKRPRYKRVLELTDELIKQFPPGTSIAKVIEVVNPPWIPLEPHEQAEHVLPLLWSLHYALTKSQWRGLRERHKRLFPDWEKCNCPKRCKANTFDEQWDYDHTRHIKTFIGAKFICPGCHWLKSPGARIKTWTEPRPPITKPPHIIDCLGWTQDRVEQLRAHDLGEHRSQQASLSKLSQQVRQGQAVALPTPIEHLAAAELEKFLASDQSMIAPWRVDLSRLSMYEYTTDEIQVFEKRMGDLAAKRMNTLG